MQRSGRGSSECGFTLIELIVVILLIAAMFAVVGFKTGTFTFWKEESFIRRLSETFVFLHHQAVTDQAFYGIEFDFKTNSYRVGVLKSDTDNSAELAELAQEAGTLSLELAAMLNPALGSAQTMIPPPSFPSLADPIPLPQGMRLQDVETTKDKKDGSQSSTALITFSPRGFSDLAVIHLRQSNNAPVTIRINAFTGKAEVYREYVEFDLGGKK